MRIESVTAHAFGPLAGPTLKFAKGMTVVVGDNESAKSTWHAAIYSALCGRPRRKGRPSAEEQWFIDRHRPWDSEAWEVSAQLQLDDGRHVELHQDLAGGVACYAKDLHLARDISNEIMEDGSPCAAAWLGLDRRSFVATACIYQAQLLSVLKEADGLQHVLQRAASTAGSDATAAEALDRLAAFQRTQVGRNDGRSTRPLRQAVVDLERAEARLAAATAAHADYLGMVELAERRRGDADREHQQLRLHEAAVARQLADEVRVRHHRAEELMSRLGDEPPSQASQADGLDTQVARALEAWTTRPTTPAVAGASSDELRSQLAALPAVPAGDLAVHETVQAAADAYERARHDLAAHAAAKPTDEAVSAPRVSQEELLHLAQRLDMPEPEGPVVGPAEEALGDQLQRLERIRRRARALLVAGMVIVVVGVVAAASGVREAGVLAALGLAIVVAAAAARRTRRLDDVRARYAQVSAAAAGSRQAMSRSVEDRRQAAARCAELGVTASGPELRALSAAISRRQGTAEQAREWGDRRRALMSAVDTTRGILRSALAERGAASAPLPEVLRQTSGLTGSAPPAGIDHDRAKKTLPYGPAEALAYDPAEALAYDPAEALAYDPAEARAYDPAEAFVAYRAACRERAHMAARAALRPAVQEQLVQRIAIEAMDAQRRDQIAAAADQIAGAARACGLPEDVPEAQAKALALWELHRNEQLRLLDARRDDWALLDSLLRGRSFTELTRSYHEAASEAEKRASELDRQKVVELATGDPAAALPLLAERARQAGEAAASAEGALMQQAKDLVSVAEAEEALEDASERVRQLQDLDEVLRSTQMFLGNAQQRIQRDLAPVLTATLTGWLPRITNGRYSEAIVDIETLAVEVCGPRRLWRRADLLSQGTSEQIYLLLRAALTRHLTAGREACPLLLDDVTVQSDTLRTQATLDLLHELANEQQVIVFAQEREVAGWADGNLAAPRDVVHRLDVLSGA